MSRNRKKEYNALTRSDPAFPWLEVGDFFRFPDPETAVSSVVGVGGNLSPGMLLSAYAQGVFPWFNEDDPLYWQSPDPRFVIVPKNFHVPSRLERQIKKEEFEIKINNNFESVLIHCAYVSRQGQINSWITEDMQEAYLRLHKEGFAHSIEAYLNGKLVGGLYGVCIGSIFFGESMFTKVSNASKIAFVHFARYFFNAMGGKLIDSQVYTDHIARFGGENISRTAYLRKLSDVFFADGLDIQKNADTWFLHNASKIYFDKINL